MENKMLKILLVDDDRFLLDMYSLKFKKSGVEIDPVSSSTGALDKLRAGNAYDVIILDIIMPTMDGIDLLKTIRAEKLSPDSVVIMLTNQSDDIEKAKAFVIDGYIIKATTIPSEVVEQVLGIYNNKSTHKL
ncbi:MAG: two-component system, OmpR family, response regulator [Patescibacteria group bacterium]|nr:two-component system, OmpR family, response regulator [Patescibacteria group bacterium]